MTLVGSTTLETRGSDAIGVFGILVIRGGVGDGRVVPNLKCICVTSRA